MKYLLATVAIAAMIASPVAAQAASGKHHARAKVHAHEARAQAPIASPDGQRHSSNPANDVYDSNGFYIGSDPDPRIRMDLERERFSFF